MAIYDSPSGGGSAARTGHGARWCKELHRTAKNDTTAGPKEKHLGDRSPIGTLAIYGDCWRSLARRAKSRRSEAIAAAPTEPGSPEQLPGVAWVLAASTRQNRPSLPQASALLARR
jgi:hypothetical protein